MKMFNAVATLVFGAVLAACSSLENADEADVASNTEALGARCTVTGNPPVTSGCDADQVCKVVACTNAIPPSCFGTCEAAPAKSPKAASAPQCEGAFDCLCGTPVCVDGEWECQGNCGSSGAGE